MSLRGYWRTLMVFIACNPAMRITKLTTNASTGRRMKRSVNDFMIERNEFAALSTAIQGAAVYKPPSFLVRRFVNRRSLFAAPISDSLEFEELFRISTFVLRIFPTCRLALDPPPAWAPDRC